MLTIDKTKNENRLVVTVSENTTIAEPVFSLTIYSRYTNKTFHIGEIENVSTLKDRYDLFVLPTSTFENIGSGIYHYAITETTENKVVEKGLVNIVDDIHVDELFISLEDESETDDDFTVYE